jgi:uncharacterized membrane protein YjgN (DUF898 family)
MKLEVANQSRIGRMLWIGFYTTALNILTLTIFRFWGRTRFRRQLWSDTAVGGEPLEYTGRGMELFIGFVIAIFTLSVPFLGAALLAQLVLGPTGLIAVVFGIYIAFGVLIGVASFLARRYHLSRSRYRGIRFAQTGSAWGYGLESFGYLLLTALTLGWAGPWARQRLSKRLWSNAYYGSKPFDFEMTPEAKAEPVYKSFAVAWVGALAAYAIWGVVLFATGVMRDMSAPGTPDLRSIGIIYLSAIPLGVIVVLAVGWHYAVMTRRITKSLSVGGLRFSSNLSAGDVIAVSLTNILLVVGTLGIGAMAAQMRMWKRIANRLSLAGDFDFEAVRQSLHEAPKQGEGLADGLDLASGF